MLDRFDWIAKAKTRTVEADALVTRIVSRFPATFRECSAGDPVGYDSHYVTKALEEHPISKFANFSEAEREDILAAAATIDPSGGRLWIRRSPIQRKTSSAPVRLLVARDHFGRGHTHLFIEQTGRTPCGLTRETCPAPCTQELKATSTVGAVGTRLSGNGNEATDGRHSTPASDLNARIHSGVEISTNRQCEGDQLCLTKHLRTIPNKRQKGRFRRSRLRRARRLRRTVPIQRRCRPPIRRRKTTTLTTPRQKLSLQQAQRGDHPSGGDRAYDLGVGADR